MKYRLDNNQYFVSLDPGDEINKSFENLAKIENIKSAWINGIGALTNMEMGYYDIESKSYIRKKYTEDYELTSLNGNITIKDGEVYSHTHITFSDKNFNVFGGHLFNGIISAAGEFIVTAGFNSLLRKYNNKIGLALWCIEE
ncbi:MAG: DNA-binding protein [Candidatus Marinimicrobia bacterium]|nr:DNA-binding protein [Candidatus Neomarinimicrobiota bacterium]|tara:strand:+ start:3378 stop:3803 length:426 start_codon:yes stop_codon:yes gene_type:complete